MRAQGYDAVKFNICEELQIFDTQAEIDGILQRLFDLRAAVGDTMPLALDFLGRVHAPMARVLLKSWTPAHVFPHLPHALHRLILRLPNPARTLGKP